MPHVDELVERVETATTIQVPLTTWKAIVAALDEATTDAAINAHEIETLGPRATDLERQVEELKRELGWKERHILSTHGYYHKCADRLIRALLDEGAAANRAVDTIIAEQGAGYGWRQRATSKLGIGYTWIDLLVKYFGLPEPDEYAPAKPVDAEDEATQSEE